MQPSACPDIIEPVSRKPDGAFMITDSPVDFDMESVVAAIKAMVVRIRDGLPIGGDSSCRCSIFPLEDLVHMAIRGELFADTRGTGNPIGLARRLAAYLLGEVVRSHTAKTFRDQYL